VSIQDWGAIGEILGGVGVILTLLYLAVQIRQNTHATRAASHHAVTDSLNQGNLAMAQDAELAQIWVTGCADRASLTEVERQRLDMLLLAYFHVFDSLFYSASKGAGEQNLLRAEEPGFSYLLGLPGVREWWEQNPYGLSPEFRSYMDGFRGA
jgi:hypothetical protein